MPADLDATDRAILSILQEEARITNVELARRVGVSPPPCLRRVRALEERGLIRGYRAVLDERALGWPVTAFAMVHLASQREADLAAFAAWARDRPEVRSTWTLSGDVDFLLKVVAPDMAAFGRLVTEMTGLPGVATLRTAVALDEVKDAGRAPLAAEAPLRHAGERDED